MPLIKEKITDCGKIVSFALHIYLIYSYFMKYSIIISALAGVSLAFSSCSNQTKTDSTAVAGFPVFDTANLDRSVHPCEDFFQFTAGGFIQNNPIPESEGRWGQFNILIESNNEKIKVILDEFSSKTDLKKGSDEQLIGDLYYSGMDSAKIEADGLSHLQSILDEVEAISSFEDFMRLQAKFKFYGVQSPFGVYVSSDSKNANQYAVYLGQSGTGMPDRDYYLKADSLSKSIQAKYRNYIATMLELSGSPREEAEKLANNIYALENAMAEAHMSKVDRRNPDLTYNKMTFAEMKQLAPALLWDDYFKGIDLQFDSVIVSSPNFIKSLQSLLPKTKVGDLKAYARYKVLNAYADQLPSAFEQAQFDFYSTTLRGTKVMKPRWKRVLAQMSGLNEQLGHLFVNRHFSPDSKQKVINMVEDLREAYRDRIKGLEWMTAETKVKALEKLDAFTYKIGYPDEWKDYSMVDVSRDSYLKNSMAISAHRTRENLSRLNKPVDRNEWFMGAHVVNAYYNSSFNEVVFPAGILQPPFYNPDADDAINYGAIGGVIGHEFTHGFDDKGSLYGADGNLGNWWTAEDRERFDALVKRVIQQYSEYEPLPGLNVNGALTVGENIADFGGITLGYYAYLKSREGKEQLAPIDGFTDKQRVFMGWAQVWQAATTDEFLRNQVLTDPHSPARYRVNGPLSNMQEFWDAFECKPEMKSFMRPDSARIVIW